MTDIGARNHPAVLALVICTLLPAACTQKQPESSSGATPVLSGRPNTTYPMPPLKAEGSTADMGWVLADGQRAKVSDYRGKVLVLDFYATWCAPCRQSVPHLVQLQRRSGPQGLQVVGLNVGGEEDQLSVSDFASEFKIQYPLGIPDKPLTDFFLSDDDSIPQTFVFNRNGELVKRFIGYGAAMPEQLEQAIQTALN
jgi:thiol-disulfide isomerase/thioredoxin